MSALERIRLGTPFRVDIVSRGRCRRVETDDVFDVVVPVVRASETAPIATVRIGAEVHEILLIEGRLFRPMLDGERRPCGVRRLWEAKPPTVGIGTEWICGDGTRTRLLGSPWRLWRETGSSEAHRGLARATPERADAAIALQASATEGLRVIDGVVFRETRAPAWFFGVDDSATRIGFPDETVRPGLALVDVRESRDRVVARAREAGFPIPRGAGVVEVHEPGLVPGTVEADSLASFCLWARRRTNCDEDGYGPVLDRLLRTCAGALRSGAPLDESHDRVRDLANCEIDTNWMSGSDLATARRGVLGARTFLKLRDDFRRGIEASPAARDADDADAIIDAFRP